MAETLSTILTVFTFSVPLLLYSPETVPAASRFGSLAIGAPDDTAGTVSAAGVPPRAWPVTTINYGCRVRTACRVLRRVVTSSAHLWPQETTGQLVRTR